MKLKPAQAFTKILALELVIDFLVSGIKAALGMAVLSVVPLLVNTTFQKRPLPNLLNDWLKDDAEIRSQMTDLSTELGLDWFAVLAASAVCGIIWWIVCRTTGPSAPHQVSRYRFLWIGLAAIYASLMGVYLLYNLLTGGAITSLALMLWAGWYALGLIAYYLASLAFTPPSVLSVVPGGSLVGALIRK